MIHTAQAEKLVHIYSLHCSALTEKIIVVLPRMKCPHWLDPLSDTRSWLYPHLPSDKMAGEESHWDGVLWYWRWVWHLCSEHLKRVGCGISV